MKDDLIIERLDALRALVVRHGEDLGNLGGRLEFHEGHDSLDRR